MKKTITSLMFICMFAAASFAQWTTGGTQISSSADDHHRPFASAVPGGGAYITWMATNTTPVNMVYLSGYDMNGNIFPGYTAGGILISQPGDFYAPYVITSEDSSAIVAWYGYPTSQTKCHIYVQKYSLTGVPQWNSGNPVKVSGGSVHNHKYPIAISDLHKGVYITWTRYDSVVGASSPDVFLQHIDSAGNVASGWNATGSAVANTLNVREYYPRLALTPDESAVYIMYSEGLVGNTSAKLKKINSSDGTLAAGWSATGLILTPGVNVYPGVYNDMYLFCDNLNNAECFWVEARSSANGEIYMQQVTPAAGILLTANGKCVGANTTDGTSYLEIVKNEEGNFLLSYNDYATSYDVDAKKIAPDGTTIWQNLTVTTNGTSAYPKVVSDGKKGMYIFYRGTSAGKLYALALDSLGVAYSGWTVPGTDFGSMGNYSGFNPNYDFDAVSTNPGQAIVTWNRQAGLPHYSVFACNLLSTGLNCSPPVFIQETQLYNEISIYPNPFENNLTVQFSSTTNSNENDIFCVFDITGKLILKTTVLPSIENAINTEELANGMYVFELKNKQEVLQRGKLIKQ